MKERRFIRMINIIKTIILYIVQGALNSAGISAGTNPININVNISINQSEKPKFKKAKKNKTSG